MEYYNKIKNLREDADMTQQDIALLLNTTRNQIGKYERGEQELPIRRLVTLCTYYHVSADYILGLPEGLPYGTSRTKHNKDVFATSHAR